MAEPAPLMNDMADAPDGGVAVWLHAGNTRIRAAFWRGGDRGTALIFTGRTEYIEKYGHVIKALLDRGFSVATCDWRGQGLSDRPLAEPMKGHIGDFGEFQRDVDAVLGLIADEGLPQPITLFCHSMGGCIGLRALVDERVEPVATVMSAPMLGIKMKPTQRVAAPLLIGISRVFGFDDKFTPSPDPLIPYVTKTSFEENMLTTDRPYFDWMQTHLRAEPALGLGPPTIGWFARAIEETRALAAGPAFRGPVLAILGGDEQVVSSRAIRSFARRSPGCELAVIPVARHEIFLEAPELRDEAWARIDAFLEKFV